MLLILIAACSNNDGAPFGSTEGRYDGTNYVPDTSSGGEETGDTSGETGETAVDTSLPETTTEPLLLGLTLVFDEDKDGLAYIAGGLEYYDVPDDTDGGKVYITVEEGGDSLYSLAHDVVDYDSWDPEDTEAAPDPTTGDLVFEIHEAGMGAIDTTLSYDFTVMLKDSAGHESADLTATLAGE